MKPKEMKDVIQLKNDIIMEQSKRIKLLEEKMTEVRKKYFQLKYSDIFFMMNSKSIEV